MRHAGLFGGHQGGELRVLAHEHVRPPRPHRGSHGREHRANVQRREYVADYQPLSVLGGQRRNTRPQWSELVFRRRGTDPERVAGAPHHAGEPWRPGHEHLVASTTTGLDERDQRMEMAGAASRGEENAHEPTLTKRRPGPQFEARFRWPAVAAGSRGPLGSVARSGQYRFHGRVDRERAAGPRDRDAVMAVAHGVRVADPDDGDRWQQHAAVLGEPDALPAAAGAPRRPERGVELLRPAGLERAADRSQRDLADTANGARPRASQRPL